MRKQICLIMCLVIIISSFVSCSMPDKSAKDERITVASSDAQPYADWIENRLGTVNDNIVIGVGSDEAYGVDMSNFEDDGYIIREHGGDVLIFGATGDGLDLAVRKYAKAAETSYVSELDEVYHEGERIKKLTVAGCDISEYTVVYPAADCNENMLFAVGELVRLIEKACGVVLPVVPDATDDKVIEFAFSDDPALKDDGYVYTVTDGKLRIEGARARGCMNGVWRFLQNELDWTGLIYGDSYLTPAEHVDVAEGTERTETPAFAFLNMYRMYWGSYKNEKGNPTSAQNSYGTYTQACHGMQAYKFCEEDFLYNQICYTDEFRYYECYDNVEAYIQRRLDAGERIGYELKEIDIAQGDNNNYCMCKNCSAVNKEEGGKVGAVVRFANRLSEELNEKYPGLVYKIFAYSGTNKAPKKTAPNEFIYITFCYDMNCSNHKIDGSECTSTVAINGRNNKDYAEWIESWTALTDNVYVWIYALDTTLQQYTVIHNIYDDFRYIHGLGIQGVFWQCQYDGLGIQRVEHQLLAELNWNMDMTEEEFEELLCRILEKEYGDGWSYIRDYIDIWQKSQQTVGCWQCWGWIYQGLWDIRYSTDYYALEFDTCVKLLENAVSLANSAAQEARAEVFTCHMYYEGCYSSYFNAYNAGDEERIAVLSDRYDLLISRMKENGFDPQAVFTVDGSRVAFKENLYEAAWSDWRGDYELITGKLLPSDAPVIEA